MFSFCRVPSQSHLQGNIVLSRRFLHNCVLASAFFFPLTQFSISAATPQEVKVDSSTLDKYVGQYRFEDEPEITLSFFRDGNQLAVESTRMAHTPLHAQAQDTFGPTGGNTRYIFLTDAGG